MVANSFDACGVPGGVKGPQPGVALSPLFFQEWSLQKMLQWPWEDLVYASSCPFKIFKPFETIALPCFTGVSDGSCVPELCCAGTPCKGILTAVASTRRWRHSWNDMFRWGNRRLLNLRMALELLRDAEASSNVSYMFPLYITVYHSISLVMSCNSITYLLLFDLWVFHTSSYGLSGSSLGRRFFHCLFLSVLPNIGCVCRKLVRRLFCCITFAYIRSLSSWRKVEVMYNSVLTAFEGDWQKARWAREPNQRNLSYGFRHVVES